MKQIFLMGIFLSMGLSLSAMQQLPLTDAQKQLYVHHETVQLPAGSAVKAVPHECFLKTVSYFSDESKEATLEEIHLLFNIDLLGLVTCFTDMFGIQYSLASQDAYTGIVRRHFIKDHASTFANNYDTLLEQLAANGFQVIEADTVADDEDDDSDYQEPLRGRTAGSK